MSITVEQIIDLVQTTQRELGRMKWTEIATDTQEHFALPNLLKKEKVGFQSGTAIEFNVMTKHSGAARHASLYDLDNVVVKDVMKKGFVPWRHWTTNYAFERREFLMNRDPARIVDLVKIRRADAMISLAELAESDFWSKPPDSDDELMTYGVKTWIVFNGSSGDGFTGGNPAGFASGVGNINSDLIERWRNWSAAYTQVTKSDFVRKLRQAYTFTEFKSPIPGGHPSYNTGNRYGMYTTYRVLGKLEEELEKQNQSLGNDIASKDGQVTFRRTSVDWVPHLEADSTDPFYGINWGVFKPFFLKGDYMREEKPERAPNQRNVVQSHVDCTLNTICRDRRRCFVLAKAA